MPVEAVKSCGYKPCIERLFIKIIFDELMARNDEYFLLKDFESYRLAQEKINNLYQDRANWSKICLANIAKSGHFSSDRTIEDYVKDIWHLNRVKI